MTGIGTGDVAREDKDIAESPMARNGISIPCGGIVPAVEALAYSDRGITQINNYFTAIRAINEISLARASSRF